MVFEKKLFFGFVMVIGGCGFFGYYVVCFFLCDYIIIFILVIDFWCMCNCCFEFDGVKYYEVDIIDVDKFIFVFLEVCFDVVIYIVFFLV